MKKLALFGAAFVLTLGLAQCKKEQTPANTASEGVFITLNVGSSTGSGTDGSRVQVNPDAEQQVTFTNEDRILVANGGHYVGYLEHNGSGFSGIITNPTAGQKLYFYFLGNKADITQLTAGSSTTCTVNISDQTQELPVISMAPSNETYPSEGNAYSATLLNQCALMEFTTNEIPVETAVTISGMKNKLTVNFNGNTLTPSEERGTITLHNTESTTKRWAILLPDDEVTTKATAEGYEESESFTVPAVAINDYLTGESGASLELYPVPLVPTTITWDNTNVFNESNKDVVVSKWESRSATFEGITITLIGDEVSYFKPYIEEDPKAELLVMGNYGDSFTFTAPSGKKFTRIEINDNGFIAFTAYGDWTGSADYNKIEWNGTAANEVTLGGSNLTNCQDLNSIVFTLVDAN